MKLKVNDIEIETNLPINGYKLIILWWILQQEKLNIYPFSFKLIRKTTDCAVFFIKS